MTYREQRRGNLTILLLTALSALVVGIALAWLKYQATFDGVDENFLVYQSRNMIERRYETGGEFLAGERLTEFPLAEIVNGQTFDFGVAEPGQLLQHTFVIKNSGNAPLEVMLEGVTCKCLTMGLEKNSIVEVAPDETFDIKLEWRSDSLTKNFQQYARIKTNDPENKRAKIELKVVGRIVSPVLASPERVSCHLRSSADSKTFEFNVHAFESDSVDPETFDLTKVEFSKPNISEYLDFAWEKLPAEELEKEKGSVAGYKVTGTVKPGAPQNVYIGKLNVETNTGHLVGLDLAVRVDAPIEIRPLKGDSGVTYYPESKMIDFGIVGQNQSPEFKMLMLYNINDPDLEVTVDGDGAEPAGFVKAEVEKVMKTGTGKVAHVRISIPADCPPARYTGPDEQNMVRVTIKSNSEFAPEVVFYVSIAKN